MAGQSLLAIDHVYPSLLRILYSHSYYELSSTKSITTYVGVAIGLRWAARCIVKFRIQPLGGSPASCCTALRRRLLVRAATKLCHRTAPDGH